MTTFSLLYGLLAIASIGLLVLLAILRIAAFGSPAGRRMWEQTVRGLAPLAPWLAFAVAAVATGGSLTYSEVAGFNPCALCWYQRIVMYPLVILLGVASARRDWQALRWYVLPLSLIGAAISAYHVVVQRTGIDSGVCDANGGCAAMFVEHFGFMTIPTMALAAFGLIGALSALPQEQS